MKEMCWVHITNKSGLSTVKGEKMNKEKCIEVLKDLSSYIDEEWDHYDPEIVKQINENMEALDFAIKVLNKSNVVGSMQLNNKQYLVSE